MQLLALNRLRYFERKKKTKEEEEEEEEKERNRIFEFTFYPRTQRFFFYRVTSQIGHTLLSVYLAADPSK